MKLVLIIGGVLLAIVLAPLVIGSLLPREHSATSSIELEAPPERVFALITDVENYTVWRTGVTSVELLESEPLRFREHGSWGDVTFEEVERHEPEEIVIRIADEGMPYGGKWTYDIEPSGNDGCTLTITEDGFIDSAYYRFMARFMFGYTSTIETYLDAVKHETMRG